MANQYEQFQNPSYNVPPDGRNYPPRSPPGAGGGFATPGTGHLMPNGYGGGQVGRRDGHIHSGQDGRARLFSTPNGEDFNHEQTRRPSAPAPRDHRGLSVPNINIIEPESDHRGFNVVEKWLHGETPGPTLEHGGGHRSPTTSVASRRSRQPDRPDSRRLALDPGNSNFLGVGSVRSVASSRRGSVFELLEDEGSAGEEKPGSNNDLTDLKELNQDTILYSLEQRYNKDIFYTYISDVTIAINPFQKQPIYGDEYHKKYTNVDLRSEHPPHIYWVAAEAYHRMCENNTSQSVLINGESGAGKTESTKYVIKHIARLCASKDNDLHEKIVEVNPLLEAFGNAKTVINDNSSRFGKLVELQFHKDGTLSGAQIVDYMLEKSRVVKQAKSEKNFHIFYYMFAGLPAEYLRGYSLQPPEKYRILRAGMDGHNMSGLFASHEERDHHDQEFKSVYKIMNHIGLDDAQIGLLFAVLSAILHLSNISFVDGTEGHSEELDIEDYDPLEAACGMLQIDRSKLQKALVKDQLTTTTAGEQQVTKKKKVPTATLR